jgi:hypothetical protein
MPQRKKGLFTKTQAIILGYGHARLYTPEKSFTLRQLANAACESGYKVDISNLYVPAGSLAVSEYLSESERTKERAHTPGAPTKQYTFSESALEPLIEYVMDGVRSSRKSTLPDILKIPLSVDAIVVYAGFFGHLQKKLMEPGVIESLGAVHPIT